MKLFFTGGTSLTGGRVAERLVQKFGAANITCLVRPTSDTKLLHQLGLKLVEGDVEQPATVASSLEPDMDYLDMSRIRHSAAMLPHLRERGITRAYFVSTTAIYSRYGSYCAAYRETEEQIQNSGLEWTILRPSMIYGSRYDHNMNKLIRFVKRAPVFPLFGGDSLMQPVFVDDVADGIVAAIGHANSANHAFDLAGPRALSYRNIVSGVGAELGRKVRFFNINTKFAAGVAGVVEKVPKFPVTREQVLRLTEDKVFDISAARDALDYAPRDFSAGIAAEVDEMRRAGLI